MTRDELAIGITNILYKLYNKLKEEGKNVTVFPSIKDQSISKNCTPSSIEKFVEIVHERNSIVGFELKAILMQGEYKGDDVDKNDIDKINVLISAEDKIILKMQYEFAEETFQQTYEEIKTFIKANSDKKIVEENIVRKRPVVVMCDFGILGSFPLSNVNFESDKDYSNKQIDDRIMKIVNTYNKDIDKFNKKVFIKIFNLCLWGVDKIDIWNENYFNDIINIGKLPSNFNELNDSEKTEILFKEKIDECDFDDTNNSRLKMFNLEKIKDNCKIYNVSINEEYHTISIEVNFLCNSSGTALCCPLIEMNYANDFEIINFDAGL